MHTARQTIASWHHRFGLQLVILRFMYKGLTSRWGVLDWSPTIRTVPVIRIVGMHYSVVEDLRLDRWSIPCCVHCTVLHIRQPLKSDTPDPLRSILPRAVYRLQTTSYSSMNDLSAANSWPYICISTTLGSVIDFLLDPTAATTPQSTFCWHFLLANGSQALHCLLMK